MQPKDKAAATKPEVNYIDYADTGFFSGIVLDYLSQHERLSLFYSNPATAEGLSKTIAQRKQFPVDRATLVNALKEQYAGILLSPKLEENIRLLLKENSFTVTTAHQPNIFTGPLYFIYKILHAIKLAESLNVQHPGYHFIPVYYMGSEDADLDELGHFTVDGKKYSWHTKQTGAVGRMKVDKAFLALITELEGQLSVLPYGSDITGIFKNAYREGKTIQQCTLELVNSLFGEYGLVVMVPDVPSLKRLFIPIVEKELKEQFSHKAVSETISALQSHYKVQAGGRDINMFYLLDDKRERIETAGNGFLVHDTGISFTMDEITQDLQQHPERFSPNVILRGVFQEMVLPNVAFIGGGGEIAYWLELKKVFDAANVPYPALVLRNSFLAMTAAQEEQLNELGFEIKDIFKDAQALLNRLTMTRSANQLSLSEEKGELNSFYQRLHETAEAIDPTLAEHVNALQVKALKKIAELEKKMLRTEKRKFAADERRIRKIRSVLFPNDSLQERVENIAGFYARYGRSFIDTLYDHSPSLEQQFTIVTI